jgi:SpoVK/Ycf46/Vps4 family AAA+-type ATPase
MTAAPMIPLQNAAGEDMVVIEQPTHDLADLTLTAACREAVDQIVLEHRHAAALAAHGLTAVSRALFVGPPGTGKTSTATAIAGALGVRLCVIPAARSISSYMGESSARIAKVLEFARTTAGVYLIDEVDALLESRSGGGKGSDREYNVLLTTILTCLDRHQGPGLIIATTNRPDVIDAAARRRFEVELVFPMPDHATQLALARAILGLSPSEDPELALGPLGNQSHADVVRLATAEKKRRVLAAIVAGSAATTAAPPPARARKKRSNGADPALQDDLAKMAADAVKNLELPL